MIIEIYQIWCDWYEPSGHNTCCYGVLQEICGLLRSAPDAMDQSSCCCQHVEFSCTPELHREIQKLMLKSGALCNPGPMLHELQHLITLWNTPENSGATPWIADVTSCYHAHHSYLFARRSRHLAFNMVTLSWPSSCPRIFADIAHSYAERKPGMRSSIAVTLITLVTLSHIRLLHIHYISTIMHRLFWVPTVCIIGMSTV